MCHDFVIELMQKLPEHSRNGWESFVSGKVKVVKIQLTLKLNKIKHCSEYYKFHICIGNRTYRRLQLAEINEKNTIVPATSYSAGTTLTSSEDDDSDFREIQFQSESLQQVNNSNISQNHCIRYFGWNLMILM